MQKTVDVSEASEPEKAKLVQQYLLDLAATYERRAKHAAEDPDAPLTGLPTTLSDKAQEVERLESWVRIIIGQHLARNQTEAMNRSMQLQQQAMNSNGPKETLLDGLPVGKMMDHIDAAKGHAQKILFTFKQRNRPMGEKQALEYLLAFETINFLLHRVGSAREC